jgi:hypothetical protein
MMIGRECWFKLIQPQTQDWYEIPMQLHQWRRGTFLHWGAYQTDQGTEGTVAIVEDQETGQTVSVLVTCLKWK